MVLFVGDEPLGITNSNMISDGPCLPTVRFWSSMAESTGYQWLVDGVQRNDSQRLNSIEFPHFLIVPAGRMARFLHDTFTNGTPPPLHWTTALGCFWLSSWLWKRPLPIIAGVCWSILKTFWWLMLLDVAWYLASSLMNCYGWQPGPSNAINPWSFNNQPLMNQQPVRSRPLYLTIG